MIEEIVVGPYIEPGARIDVVNGAFVVVNPDYKRFELVYDDVKKIIYTIELSPDSNYKHI